MIVDFRELEDGALIEADLCILGAGAAGITLAREFVGSGVQVCLTESGGLEYEHEVQDLYAGENVGQPYFALDASRLRYFGGSTNHWAGLCGFLTPLDCEVRPWVPYSGWPFSRQALEPFYRRARSVCELEEYDRAVQAWRSGRQLHEFDPGEVDLAFVQYSPPTRFGEVYRGELERSGNIRIVLHANAVNIQTNEAASVVEHVELRSLQGTAGRVRAKLYVVACGGIENARLLLLSDTVEPAGLGNRHDLVGRFFMEHPQTDAGIVVADDSDDLRERYGPGEALDSAFSAGATMQAREQVLNSQALLRRIPDPDSGIRAARELWWGIKHGGSPDELAEKVWRVMRDFDDVVRFAYRRLTAGSQSAYGSVETLGFSLSSEQAPNPDSRVTLIADRDALGLRRVQLDWRLTELDKRTVGVMVRTLGAEFARLEIGRVRVLEELLDGSATWSSDMIGGNHHMGTTRMAADPRQGVVDGECRVHHIDNLYIAGSSVFPTGGCTNPTLTIVALAVRLADHCKARLAS